MTINEPTTARSCLVTMPGSSFFGFKVRGVQVMLDFDLAEIYGYTTKAFDQQVRNNIQKFDDDFRFQLTREEIDELSRSKNLTSIQTKGVKDGRAYLPWAFTESGIYMLIPMWIIFKRFRCEDDNNH